MPWFAAHVVLYFQRRDDSPGPITAWENVHLVEAPDAAAARAAAAAIGRASEVVDGMLHEVDATGPHSVAQRFAGVRKVVAVQHEDAAAGLRSGDELTYAEFTLDGEDALRRLASGDPVGLTYTDG